LSTLYCKLFFDFVVLCILFVAFSVCAIILCKRGVIVVFLSIELRY